eukprot:scaffold181389_cov20-Tisochrysis_lutea.AAC.1
MRGGKPVCALGMLRQAVRSSLNVPYFMGHSSGNTLVLECARHRAAFTCSMQATTQDVFCGDGMPRFYNCLSISTGTKLALCT